MNGIHWKHPWRNAPSWKLVTVILRIYRQNPSLNPIVQSACVSTANEHFVRKIGSRLETTLAMRGGVAQTRLVITSLSRGGSPRTSDNHTVRMNCRPLLRLLRLAIAKIMIVTAPPAVMTATTVAALSGQEPLPLPGTTALPNSSAVRERTMMAATVDVCQHVLAVLTATLVSEGMEKRRPGLACHCAGGRSSIDCQPPTAWVNEMQWRIDLMIEVLSQMLVRPPAVRTRRASAGITADVEEGLKVVEDSQLALKMHSRYP